MVGKLLLYYQNRFVLMNYSSTNKDENKTGRIYVQGRIALRTRYAELNRKNREWKLKKATQAERKRKGLLYYSFSDPVVLTH